MPKVLNFCIIVHLVSPLPQAHADMSTTLEVKICSARGLTHPLPPHLSARVEYSCHTRSTRAVPRKTDRPMWNQTFRFPVDEDCTLIRFSLHAGNQAAEIGMGECFIPDDQDLRDFWLDVKSEREEFGGLKGSIRGEDTRGYVEGDGSMGGASGGNRARQNGALGESVGGNAAVGIDSKSNGSMGRDVMMRNDAKGNAPLDESPAEGRMQFHVCMQLERGTMKKSKNKAQSVRMGSIPSAFQANAGAVTINDIVRALDGIKSVVYLAGQESERYGKLQDARRELEDLKTHIREIKGLSEEWKIKLADLVEEYESDCISLLADHTWANRNAEKESAVAVSNQAPKRESVKPPPLPSKETLARVRSERFGELVDGKQLAPPSLAVAPKINVNLTMSINPAPPLSPIVRPASFLGSSSPITTSVTLPQGRPSLKKILSSTLMKSGSFSGNNGLFSSTSPSTKSPLPSTSPTFQTEADGNVVMLRPHYLSSLDAFDEMMDTGYAIEFKKPKVSGTLGKVGATAKLEAIGFVFDGCIGQAVSFVVYPESEPFEFVLGTEHPDVPRGLELALVELNSGSSSVLVTIAPEYGFGEDGHDEFEIPPDATLIYDIRHVTFVQAKTSFSSAPVPPRVKPSSEKTQLPDDHEYDSAPDELL